MKFKAPKPPKIMAQMDARQLKKLDLVSRDLPSVARLFRHVFERQGSPRMAIKAQCLDCCGLDRTAITECLASACPLWHFRPYQP